MISEVDKNLVHFYVNHVVTHWYKAS